ncbi:MAG: hypothetical protein LBS51_03035 [Oscillospiraceae bacterium]|jgi:hypothetical protein|nr:hypothetical protein [Oscillospiraceae bacterium]
MKKYGTFLTAVALALALALSLFLPSCSFLPDGGNQGAGEASKGSIHAGAWSEDGRTFTNGWSNVKLTLPDGYRALSPGEIEEMVGAGEEIVVNDGNKAAYDLAKTRTAYDFIIATDAGMPNIMLMYENIDISPLTKNLDESGYFNMLSEQLKLMDTLSYEELGTETRTVAGENFVVGMVSLAGGAAFQDYYIRKLDGAMIIFSATYTEDTRDAALDVMALIGTAE